MAASKTTSFITLLLLVFVSFSEAREFLVGGSPDAWKIPESDPEALDKWAEEFRFLIGDSLVWKYESGKDSVLEVTKDAYLSCNTSNPIAEYNDGNTTVKLTRSGPHYFISGAAGHCEKGQKLTVVVISTKHSKGLGASPAPAPVGVGAGSPVGEVGLGPKSNYASMEGVYMMVLGALMGFYLLW